jgi:hypothetical protein
VADFAFVDDADGNLVEVPVRVEYTFTPGEKPTSYLSSYDGAGDPGEPPSIADFRVVASDGRDITTLLHKDELDRLISLCWENEGVERPMLDLSCYMPNPPAVQKPAEAKPPKLTAPSHTVTQTHRKQVS